MNDYNILGYKEVCDEIPIQFPPQHQNEQPAMEYLMNPLPVFDNPNYIGSNKLKGKVAIITGGDSGIGRAISVIFAKEGADIVIVYYDEHKDAMYTKNYVESLGRRCLLFSLDIRDEECCKKVINETIKYFNKIDIIVNNAGVAYSDLNDFGNNDILLNTFYTNIFSYFYMVKYGLPYLSKGSVIINTASSTAYIGYPNAVSYSASKGAVVSYTRSLANSLVSKGIRVNAVAPGPTWTPLITASIPLDMISTFGSDTPMRRAAQPYEIAPAYVFLASDDSSYITGEVIHVDGGSTMQS